jgi:hypothetical protein
MAWGGPEADLWDFCGARQRSPAAHRAVASHMGNDAVVGAAGAGAAALALTCGPGEHEHTSSGVRCVCGGCYSVSLGLSPGVSRGVGRRARRVPDHVVDRGSSRSLLDSAAGIAAWLDAREPGRGGDLICPFW